MRQAYLLLGHHVFVGCCHIIATGHHANPMGFCERCPAILFPQGGFREHVIRNLHVETNRVNYDDILANYGERI
jgi:hypothetical protein